MTTSATPHPIARILSRDESGEQQPLPLRQIVSIGAGASAIFGFTMGLYAWLDRGGEGLLQCAVSAIKVPLLFLLTGLITFPSLLVFAQLLAVPLRPAAAVRMAVTAMSLSSIVLASLAPVLAFFSLNTRSYPFMLLLNVMFFAVAGGIGVVQLERRLVAAITIDSSDPEPGTGRRSSSSAPSGAAMLRVWAVVFALVGCQTSWMLRPFVLAPDQPFELFRDRGSHFFAGVLAALRLLFGG